MMTQDSAFLNKGIMDKKKKELDSIKKAISTIFYNEDSPYYQTLNPTSIYVPTVEDHKWDASAMTRDNKEVLLEVKSTPNCLYDFDDEYNDYFFINGKYYSFENVPEEDDDMFVRTATFANCPSDISAYSTTIPEEYQNIPYYYINAASTGPKQGEIIFENGCKLKKMLYENQAFAYVFTDGVLYYTPDEFQKALGPYIRKWCKNKQDYNNELVSWEVKRLLDLRKGTFIHY